MDDERSLELSDEEKQYIEEVILFNRAGVKLCIFNKIDGEICNGEVKTIGRDGEKDAEGNQLTYGLRMNICEGHFDAPEKEGPGGWRVIPDEEEGMP